jgi:hypothetical protein
VRITSGGPMDHEALRAAAAVAADPGDERLKVVGWYASDPTGESRYPGRKYRGALKAYGRGPWVAIGIWPAAKRGRAFLVVLDGVQLLGEGDIHPLPSARKPVREYALLSLAGIVIGVLIHIFIG